MARKGWKLPVWGMWILLLVAYVCTRIFHLTILPIFTDEAIYIRWSQIGSQDAAWRFISLVDGKQPMFTWIMMVVMRFIHDPLIAGRLVSVGAGCATLVGLWMLSWELFKKYSISIWVCIVYILSPFTLMYDRLAMYDSLVAAFSVWNLWLAIRLVRTIRLDNALLFGMVLGAGMLNKSSGFLSLYLVPVTLLLFDWHSARIPARLARWLGMILISTFVSQLMYGVLRLSPLYHMIGLKDLVFIYSFKEWASHPFDFLYGNLHGLLDWLIHYLTWPVFIAALLGVVVARRFRKESTVLLLYWVAPMMALASFGRVLYPRFVLFMAMPLLVLSGFFIVWLLSKTGKTWLAIFALTALLFSSVITDYFILVNPKYASIPRADRGQLIDDWPAGWGIAESVGILTQAAKQNKIAIYTDGTFGLLPYAVEMYLVDNPNVSIYGVWPMPATPSAQMRQDIESKSTYLILNQIQTVPAWQLRELGSWAKGNSKEAKLRLFQFEEQSL